MKKLKYFLCVLPLLASCTAEPPINEDVIELNGAISNSYETKTAAVADAYRATKPSAEKPLEADIWFSTTSGYYNETGGLNVHKTIKYIGPSNTSPSPDASGKYLRYPTDGSDVYCVGLYPLGEWSTSDGYTATATIDGEKDLMFAPQMSGNEKKTLNSYPQVFNHELTWVKIRVRAESEFETAETWGNIRQIYVSSAEKANVNLGTGNVTFSGNTSILAFDGDTTMNIGSTELGSVLVSSAPAQESGDKAGVRYFNVSLICDNHSRYDVPVYVTDYDGKPYKGETKGLAFVLILYFKTLPSVEFTATLSSWEDEGRVLELEKKVI